MPNLTNELSTAKERRLNPFGSAVLVWCGKSVKFDRVCRTFVELNLGSTHGATSESDVAPASFQSRTYSIRFGTDEKSVSEPGLTSVSESSARSLTSCPVHNLECCLRKMISLVSLPKERL